jgi:hypothetical protein
MTDNSGALANAVPPFHGWVGSTMAGLGGRGKAHALQKTLHPVSARVA